MRARTAGSGKAKDVQKKRKKEQTEEEVRPKGQAGTFEELVEKKNPSDSMKRVRKIERCLIGSSRTDS